MLSALSSQLTPLVSRLSPLPFLLPPLTSHLSPLTSHLNPQLSPLTSHTLLSMNRCIQGPQDVRDSQSEVTDLRTPQVIQRVKKANQDFNLDAENKVRKRSRSQHAHFTII
jgi:hypothetical protein